MSRKSGNPAVLRETPEKTLPAAIADYRRWVRLSLDGLLAGNTAAWKEFRRRRGSLRKAGPIARRLFEWEEGFLRETAPIQTVPRAAMCRIGGISPSALRSYQDLGLLGARPRGKAFYRAEDLKRLQWVLFLLRELKIPASGLSLLLSFESINLRVAALSRSVAANLPIHYPPPCGASGSGQGVAEAAAGGDKVRREMFHDLGNRFHVIGGRANLLRRKMAGTAEAERNLAIILAQLASAEGILQDLKKNLLPNENPNAEKDDGAHG